MNDPAAWFNVPDSKDLNRITCDKGNHSLNNRNNNKTKIVRYFRRKDIACGCPSFLSPGWRSFSQFSHRYSTLMPMSDSLIISDVKTVFLEMAKYFNRFLWAS